jgi:uncharacterized protein (TIGR03546 family)
VLRIPALLDPPAAPERIPLVLSPVIALIRKTLHALLACDSPGQLAGGFALGMIIGLVPKGNLIALSLCVLIFSMRCNKGLAIVAAVIFSSVATWTDPFAHKLGQTVLGLEPLQATYASLFELPLGPWLGFNNTVVAGSLLLGLYVAYPVYWLVWLICSMIRSAVTSRSTCGRAASQVGGAL